MGQIVPTIDQSLIKFIYFRSNSERVKVRCRLRIGIEILPREIRREVIAEEHTAPFPLHTESCHGHPPRRCNFGISATGASDDEVGFCQIETGHHFEGGELHSGNKLLADCEHTYLVVTSAVKDAVEHGRCVGIAEVVALKIGVFECVGDKDDLWGDNCSGRDWARCNCGCTGGGTRGKMFGNGDR